MAKPRKPIVIGEHFQIDSWVAYVKESKERYNRAKADLDFYTQARGDIIHAIEIGDDRWTLLQLAKLLRSVCRKRREAKDTIAMLDRIVSWHGGEKNGSPLEPLQAISDKMQEYERNLMSREYKPRTSILDKNPLNVRAPSNHTLRNNRYVGGKKK